MLRPQVYERAIANVPPVAEKRYWRRYIYLWVNYALFEELQAEDMQRTRSVKIFTRNARERAWGYWCSCPFVGTEIRKKYFLFPVILAGQSGFLCCFTAMFALEVYGSGWIKCGCSCNFRRIPSYRIACALLPLPHLHRCTKYIVPLSIAC